MHFGYTRLSPEEDESAAPAQFKAPVERLAVDRCSGRDKNRPQLTELLSVLGEGDVLFVPSLDKLAGTLRELLTLLDQITARGAELRLIKENLTLSLNPTDPSNRLAFQIFGALSAWEKTLKDEGRQESPACTSGKRRGRPTQVTDAQRELVLQAFQRDQLYNVARLSRETGVPETTCRDIRRKMLNNAYAGMSLPCVWHWKECTLENLLKALSKVQNTLSGRIAVKLNAGEPNETGLIPPLWVKELVTLLPNARAVECNVLYDSPRRTTEGHRKVFQINGWDIPIDIMDAEGDTALPVQNGFHLKEVAVGKNLITYNSLLVLTQFKGRTAGGFGGSLKNIAIGCASGNLGKAQVHGVGTAPLLPTHYKSLPAEKRFIEAMADSGKAITDHFKNHYACINLVRHTKGQGGQADFGIFASTDILAIDQASVDYVTAHGRQEQAQVIMTQNDAPSQLSAMNDLKMGSRVYKLVEM